LLQTIDGAISWNTLTTAKDIIKETNGKIHWIDFVSEELGWVIIEDQNNKYRLFRTSNQGENWNGILPVRGKVRGN
jgi:hypothetical protein